MENNSTGIHIQKHDIFWICKILCESRELVQNREKLFFALGLPDGQLPDLIRSITLNDTGTHGFFTFTISKWIEYKSSKATVTALINTLKDEKFVSSADSINEEWSSKYGQLSSTGHRGRISVPIARSISFLKKSKPPVLYGTKGRKYKDIIQESFTRLCDLTIIHEQFLTECHYKQILTIFEIENIESSPIQYHKARKFYESILQKDSKDFEKLIQLMELHDKELFKDVLPILKKTTLFSQRSNTIDSSREVWFEVKKPPTYFTRTEEELTDLHNMITREDQREVSTSQITVLLGKAGMGKGSIIRKYLDVYAQYFQGVIWINSETRATIEGSFDRLMKANKWINIPHSGQEWFQVVQKIYEYFPNRRFLFIFDYVSYAEDVDKFLPQNIKMSSDTPSILLISRNPDLKKCYPRTLELCALTETVAVNIIRDVLIPAHKINIDPIKKLVLKLKNLPYAIQQAVSYVEKAQSRDDYLPQINPIIEYLNLLEKSESGIWFGVAEPPDNFTGREIELMKLHKLVTQQSENSKLTAVVGLGGIGKTSLVRQYAWVYGNEYFNGNIIWINATTRYAMTQCFHRLALKLNIRTDLEGGNGRKEIEDLLEEIYNFFSNKKCLFIFDDVYNETHCSVDKFLPTKKKPDYMIPSVLMTSRQHNMSSKRVTTIDLDLLSEEQAIEFIRKELCIDTNDDSELQIIKILANKLQCLPLALQQAMSSIKNIQNTHETLRSTTGDSPLKEYLDLFQINAHKLLQERKFTNLGSNSEYENNENAVMLTWSVTFEEIEKKKHGNTAIEIMKLIAYFDEANIDVEIFASKFSEDDLRESIILLRDYSMIRARAGFLSVHRLVQQVIRIQEKERNNEMKLIKNAMNLTYKYTWEYIMHRACIWNYALDYKKLAKKFVGYGLQVCAWMNFDDEVQLEIFQKTSNNFNIFFKEKDKVKMELLHFKLLNFCRSRKQNTEQNTKEILKICKYELEDSLESPKSLEIGKVFSGYRENLEKLNVFDSFKKKGIPEALSKYGRVSNNQEIIEIVLRMYQSYVEYYTNQGDPAEVIYCIKIVIRNFKALNKVEEALVFSKNVNKNWIDKYGRDNEKVVRVVNGTNKCLLSLDYNNNIGSTSCLY